MPDPLPSGTSRRPRPPSWRPRPPDISTPPSARATPPRSAGCTRWRSPNAGPCSTSSCPASPTPRATDEQAGNRPGRPARARTPARRTGPRSLTSPPTAAGPSVRASTWCTTPTPCGCPTCRTRTPPVSRWCSTRPARRTGLPRAPRAAGRRVPYPGSWPSLQPLRLVVEPGDTLAARVDGHEVHVSRARRASRCGWRCPAPWTSAILDKFGLWRSHLASVADPADGYTTDEVVAAAALMRAASSGLDLVADAVDGRFGWCTPFPRPSGHRSSGRSTCSCARPAGRWRPAPAWSTCTARAPTRCVVRARWTETVDDLAAPGAAGSVQVRRRGAFRRRGSRTHRGAVPLRLPADRPARRRRSGTSASTGCCRPSRTPTTAASPTCPVAPPGTRSTSRRRQIPGRADPHRRAGGARHPVLGTPGGTAWCSTRCRCCAGRSRPSPTSRSPGGRSGAPACGCGWPARGSPPATASCSACSSSTPDEWVQEPAIPGRRSRRRSRHRTAPPACGRQTRSSSTAAPRRTRRCRRCSRVDQLLLDLVESGVAEGVGIRPPLAGRGLLGGRDRGWTDVPGNPVAVAATVPLRDVRDHPSVRVLGYQPEYDEESGPLVRRRRHWSRPPPCGRSSGWRWRATSHTRSRVRQLSPVALTSWVQPLPTRTLTVSRTGRQGRSR